MPPLPHASVTPPASELALVTRLSARMWHKWCLGPLRLGHEKPRSFCLGLLGRLLTGQPLLELWTLRHVERAHAGVLVDGPGRTSRQRTSTVTT